MYLNSRYHIDIHSGNLLRPSTFPPRNLEQFSKNPDLSSLEKSNFLDFIGAMVRTDPEERLDARQLLESAWLA